MRKYSTHSNKQTDRISKYLKNIRAYYKKVATRDFLVSHHNKVYRTTSGNCYKAIVKDHEMFPSVFCNNLGIW